MNEGSGLVCAYEFDGSGGGRGLGWSEIRERTEKGRWLWVHLQRGGVQTEAWLRQQAQVDQLVCDALLAKETRPRSGSLHKGLLLILRGVNLNPGADPEDMVSIRLWIEERRVISVRVRQLMAIQDIRSRVPRGVAPATPGDFLAQLAEALVERMGPVIDGLEGRIDGVEEAMDTGTSTVLRDTIASLRRQAIILRRYLAPQRDVMGRLLTETSVLGERNRLALRETADQITRYVEDLDAARERANVTQDELRNRLAEQMNKTMYMLSVVAGIFLPLGLITGLLGINVGGIPGAETPWAFAFVTGLLTALGLTQAAVFRRWRVL